MERENAWKKYDEAGREKVFRFGKDYKQFLSAGKTERECVEEIVREIEAAGYQSLQQVIDAGVTLKPGDKVYANNMGKTLALYHMGEEPMEKGMNILGAHIDSPRLDLKQNPLYEDTDMAMLETHYYGGVKKYQWVALPLALHGVMVKRMGVQ